MYVLCFKSNHSISQKNVKISSLQNIFQSFMYLLFLSTPSSFMYFFIQFFNIRFFHFGFFLFIHPKQYKIVWGIFVCIVWDLFLSCLCFLVQFSVLFVEKTINIWRWKFISQVIDETQWYISAMYFLHLRVALLGWKDNTQDRRCQRSIRFTASSKS